MSEKWNVLEAFPELNTWGHRRHFFKNPYTHNINFFIFFFIILRNINMIIRTMIQPTIWKIDYLPDQLWNTPTHLLNSSIYVHISDNPVFFLCFQWSCFTAYFGKYYISQWNFCLQFFRFWEGGGGIIRTKWSRLNHSERSLKQKKRTVLYQIFQSKVMKLSVFANHFFDIKSINYFICKINCELILR